MRHYRRYWKHGDYPIIAILVYEYSVADVSEMPYDAKALNNRIARIGFDGLPHWITPVEIIEPRKV